MNEQLPKAKPAAEWVYTGVWRMLVDWFRVPQIPPTLPGTGDRDEVIDTFKPDRGFLRYLKLQFWVVLLLIDLSILVGWIILAVVMLPLALVLAIPALAIAIIPDIVAYVAIHLRYDTTWYVMSDRSLRIRRGIWIIHETTITFENIQNIKLQQGPVQRYFGISDLIVETAGGGGGSGGSAHGGSGQSSLAHKGIIQGIANAADLRQRILVKLRATGSAGLGDDSRFDSELSPIPLAAGRSVPPAWTTEHLSTLREIRTAIRQLHATPPGSS